MTCAKLNGVRVKLLDLRHNWARGKLRPRPRPSPMDRDSPLMADIVIINPRFEISYWGMEHALPLTGKRANMPVACLPLLAALTPAEHSVTLIDENIEALNWERIARADIVGVTGMSVQRQRHARDSRPSSRTAAASPWSAGRGSASRRIISATWPTSSSWAKPRRPGRASSKNGNGARTNTATNRPKSRT